MELREVLLVFRRYARALALAAGLFGLAAFAVSSSLPVKYQAATTVFVKRQAGPESASYFTYEGYYAQMTASEYANTVVGFLKSDDILKRALEIVERPSDQKALGEVRNAVFAKKIAPQLVFLTVTRRDQSEARGLASALVQATQERSNLLNQTGDRGLSIDTLNPNPIVKTLKPQPLLNAAVAVTGGLLLALLAAFLFEYLRAGQA